MLQSHRVGRTLQQRGQRRAAPSRHRAEQGRNGRGHHELGHHPSVRVGRRLNEAGATRCRVAGALPAASAAVRRATVDCRRRRLRVNCHGLWPRTSADHVSNVHVQRAALEPRGRVARLPHGGARRLALAIRPRLCARVPARLLVAGANSLWHAAALVRHALLYVCGWRGVTAALGCSRRASGTRAGIQACGLPGRFRAYRLGPHTPRRASWACGAACARWAGWGPRPACLPHHARHVGRPPG
jgi:hypothetical protein